MPKRSADEDSITGNNGKPKIRRKRAVHVCARCKDLKLKCDLNEPCSACIRAKVEKRCIYKPWRDEDGPDPVHSSSNASLSARVQQLEKQLSHSSPGSPLHREGEGSRDEWKDIVVSLPPIRECRDLLDKFYLFDIMFRTIHQPSFKRRANQILSSHPAISPDNAPFLARMVLGMYIGGRNNTRGNTSSDVFFQLDTVIRRLFSYIEYQSETQANLLNLDYVAALHSAVYRYMHGTDSSIKLAYIAIGKAVNAALLLRLDKDPTEVDPMMSTFEAEIRRRLWHTISVSEKISSLGHKLSHVQKNYNATVLPPTMIPDENLESGTPAPLGSIVEWAYIMTKIRSLSTNSQIKTLKRQYPNGLPYDKVVEAYDMLTSSRLTLDDHLRVDRDRPIRPEEPPWVFAQACVKTIGHDHGIITFLRPELSSVDLSIQAYALPRAISAAKDLIDTAQSYITHLLFRWQEGLSLNLWTFGSKIFQAALVISYAIFSDRTSSSEKSERVGTLDTAIGALGVMTNESKSCGTNDQALAVLKMLRQKITDGILHFGPEYPGILDPYTGDKVELLTQTSPDVTELLQTPMTSDTLGAEASVEWDFGDLLDWENWERFLNLPGTGGTGDLS